MSLIGKFMLQFTFSYLFNEVFRGIFCSFFSLKLSMNKFKKKKKIMRREIVEKCHDIKNWSQDFYLFFSMYSPEAVYVRGMHFYLKFVQSCLKVMDKFFNTLI